mgnify:FL=1|jgi:adenylyltransferase/sulfurtransferase
MAQLIIPTPLRKFTDGQGVFSEDAASVKELLAALAAQHPGLKPHLFEDSGSLRSFIRVYVGDEDIHALQGEDTALQAGDEVSIIPAIAGGI